MLCYFERRIWYFESISCTLKVYFLYFESAFLYFATMLASGCIENQYSKGKEKVVINVHFINANLLAVGDTTYIYFLLVFLFVVVVVVVDVDVDAVLRMHDSRATTFGSRLF